MFVSEPTCAMGHRLGARLEMAISSRSRRRKRSILLPILLLLLQQLLLLAVLVPRDGAVIILARSQGSSTERSILQSFVEQSGNSRSGLADWIELIGENSSDPCRWPGVGCSSLGLVTELDLRSRGLGSPLATVICGLPGLQRLILADNSYSETFPEGLFNCTGLTELDLSYNGFYGQLPGRWSSLSSLTRLGLGSNLFSGQLPRSLGNELPGLEYLDLWNNTLGGFIPEELGNLSRLQNLSLAWNAFDAGPLPESLAGLSGLTWLFCARCNVEGAFPGWVTRLRSLQWLDLSGNQIQGSLPDTVFVDDDSSIWPNMTKLELYDNALGGPIPRWIGNLSRLTDLDLSCNALVGPIPAELGRVPGLALLNLWNNSLSGEIPESLANLTRLRIFQVFQNELAGVIPGAIGASSGSLEIFDVSSNYALSGGVPARLCDGGSLVKLIAFSNALSGSFPAGYGRCPTLARVRMQGNLLSGSVSDSVWELPNLNYLDLSDNNLSGPVLLLRDPPDPPTTTPAIAPIAYLLLARNSFSGDLPDAIGRFGLLEVLDLSGNRLSGSVPAALADCLRLQKLILGSNALSGPIPGDLASGLQSLDLSGNRFSGAIPESLGGLAMLSTLNLSSNHLSGAVPESLAQLRASLDAFDASFNELSGELPFALGGPFTAESFRGNPGLCINIGCGSGVGGGAMGAAGKPDKTRWIIASLLLIFSFLAAAAAAAAACWWCYLRKARRELWQRIEDNGIGSSSSSRLRYSPKDWTLTPFEKVGFTVHEILRSLDDEDAILGKGASGRVYLCKLDNGTAVAIKKLREQDRGQKQRHRDHGFGAEVATLGRVRHANVVRLICCCTDSRTATNLLVFEYMPNGSLGDALFGHGGVIKGKNNPHLLGWDLRLRIALGSARGLAYLHHDCVPPIVHRDVKSSNILLDARFDAHIADFGLAKSIPDSPADVKALQNSGVVGSVGYMAPELGYGPSKVSEKGDVYSYGVVLLELLTGRRASGAESGGPSLLEWVRGKLTSRHEVTNSLFFFNSADEDKSGSATCSEVSQKELREMLVVLKLALRCTDRVAMLRPSMKEAVDILEDVWRRGGYQIAAKSGPSKHRKKIEEDAQQSLPSPGDSFRLELCRAEFAGR